MRRAGDPGGSNPAFFRFGWPSIVLASAAAVLFASLLVRAKEDRQVGFHLAMLVLPAGALLFPTPRLVVRVGRSILTVAVWGAFYAAYVDFMNHPWFSGPETNMCDGRCFGWYSFENDPSFDLHAANAVVSLLVGAAVLGLRRRRSRPR